MEIAIIGGGITGLTTALALKRLNIDATVYEKAPHLNEIGAGVWLQPNAIRVLQWLGIAQEVQSQGFLLNKMEITDSQLNPFKKIKNDVVSDQFGNQTIAIHRGKLQRLLHDMLSQHSEVKLNKAFQSFSVENDRVHVQFENSATTADLVLGADGIHSKVRSAMRLPSQFRKSGQICCRGIANFQMPKALQHEGKEVWGNKLRFGFSQLSKETVYFFAVINKSICPNELNRTTLSTLFKDFHPVILELINNASGLHISELMDLKRLDSWHNSTTCLLGDAAHATTPNMGQGACQGIEDAYYISQLLNKHLSTPVDAFQIFEDKRRAKVDYVVNNSWRFGKMAHDALGQKILKGMMQLTPESMMSNQMNKLYSIEEIQ
ncbi:FAD-dependent oxidoreductase [Roseivirga pacifica]|uniref:FAD-dependent oxidoreductase n=1 Tax=Roseivirga pacifica TaxID=1267423 RepID=UPI003BAB910B